MATRAELERRIDELVVEIDALRDELRDSLASRDPELSRLILRAGWADQEIAVQLARNVYYGAQYWDRFVAEDRRRWERQGRAAAYASAHTAAEQLAALDQVRAQLDGGADAAPLTDDEVAALKDRWGIDDTLPL